MVFNKPFVEKPLSAEDHNVYIYYPSSVGGVTIFDDKRKVSLKVYAVGPYYAHAEARKAPGLDGKVERDSHGKEVRYPVILSSKEKTIARKVVIAF
uniref:Uncharacterized protein n=1 Tax=Parascaris equorum TaxID=6256 RepID=A0A914S1X3_PAREQ